MPGPLEARALDEEELATPGAAVVAEPEAVEREPERGAGPAVLGQHRGDVRVVVLHGEGREARAERPPRREELRVQIVHHQLRRDLEGAREVRDGLLEKEVGLHVVEIAEVLRHVGAVAAHEAHGVLLVRAHGQYAVGVDGQANLFRGVAARTPEQARGAVDDAGNAVVAAHDDGTIVGHDHVGDAREPFVRGVVVLHEGLASGIGRRHHEDDVRRLVQPRGPLRAPGGLEEEQPVERGVREHEPERVEIGRDRGGDLRRGAGAADHDGAADSGQERALLVAQDGEALGRRNVERHHGEGLAVAVLAPAELGDRADVRRVADEVVAAEPLQRDDLPASEPLGDLRHGHREARAAGGARHGLRVEAPIERDRGTRARRRRTAETPPSRCWAGRRGRGA